MKRLVLCSLLAFSAWSYEYKPGDWLLHAVLGRSVTFVRDDATTIGQNILAGLEGEYMLSPRWSVTAAIRPTFGESAVLFGLGVGGKYRWIHAQTPLVPFAAFALTPSFYIPTVDGFKGHFNLGFRPSGGFEYFVSRDLSLGLEAALTPSFVFGGNTRNTLEASIEVLAGATWRI
ncbi:MAG: hypothetical protein I8H75_05210 [Myxococcaceae bacterium]|nr:hypothetical protein [Myxococcaceae bacterium]MBH2006721.1 hypothetical protein [Myxococcaceae bacterium]